MLHTKFCEDQPTGSGEHTFSEKKIFEKCVWMTDRHIQGQLIPQSRVESGSNSNSSKMLWLSLLLPRMKKIRSKLKR